MRRRIAGRLGADAGSVMLLGIGMVAVCLVGLAVATDASAMFVQRSRLMAVADAAALAGAQALDIDDYYATGASTSSALTPAMAEQGVRRHLAEASGLPEGLRIEAISSDGGSVRVRLSAPMALPFSGQALGARTEVESAARLDFWEWNAG